MLKLLGMIWRSVMAFGGLLGLLYLGPDWAGREAALEWWEANSPVSSFTVVIIIYGLAVLWIIDLEIRRALARPEWPTLRKSIWRGLSILFREDLRRAELQKIAGDDELKRQRAAAEAEKLSNRADAQRVLDEMKGYLETLFAEHKLSVFDASLPPAHRLLPPKDGDWSNFVTFLPDVDNGFHAALSSGMVNVLLPKLADNFERARRELSVAHPRPEEEGISWPDDKIRFRWLNLMARADAYEKTRDEARQELVRQTSEAGRAILVERILRRWPRSTEPETQP